MAIPNGLPSILTHSRNFAKQHSLTAMPYLEVYFPLLPASTTHKAVTDRDIKIFKPENDRETIVLLRTW